VNNPLIEPDEKGCGQGLLTGCAGAAGPGQGASVKLLAMHIVVGYTVSKPPALAAEAVMPRWPTSRGVARAICLVAGILPAASPAPVAR
jgi:hypothetical protein